MSAAGSWLSSPPPDAAVEISTEFVSIAAIGRRGGAAAVQGYAMAPLPPGAVVPSLTAHNIVDRAAVAGGIAQACDRLGWRPRRVGLVMPDVAARVSLVRFDRVPSRHGDLEDLLRWQIKKSAPFLVDDALLAYAPGARTGESQSFVAVLARREIVREYEDACEANGMHPGIVDVSTLSVVNLYLAADSITSADWLLVHMRPDYTSIVLMRGANVIFFRCRTEGEEDALADVVHQTVMYYQDRLEGRGLSRLLVGGTGRGVQAVEAARRSLEARLESAVESIDATRIATMTDRITTNAQTGAMLAPLLGMLLRGQRVGAVS